MDDVEIIAILLATVFVLAPIIGAFALLANSVSRPKVSSHVRCEQGVSYALRSLDPRSYVVLDNLILNSNGNTAHAEIDHIVVSPYGIFCVVTKSHQGYIYGSRKSARWYQYLGNYKFPINNPFRQNYKHVKALDNLLDSSLKTNIHSYAVFPNAKKVKVDGEDGVATVEELVRNISQKKEIIYNKSDCEHIIKLLAQAKSTSSDLKETHINEVCAYLSSKSI